LLYASYKPSYGDIEIQTLFDTEQDHYQVLGVGWNKKERFYGCSMHLDITPFPVTDYTLRRFAPQR
jgi:hypothetical protein